MNNALAVHIRSADNVHVMRTTTLHWLFADTVWIESPAKPTTHSSTTPNPTTQPLTSAPLHTTTTLSPLTTSSSGAHNTTASSLQSGGSRLVITAKYLLSVNCSEALVDPQPAILQAVAKYKYKDLILVCGK
mgnify:FL=1